MANLTEFKTRYTVGEILEQLPDNLRDAVVISWDDNNCMTVASNMGDADIILAMDVARAAIIEAYFDEFDD